MSTPIILPCIHCGYLTEWACSDCAIDSGGTVKPHVCHNRGCQTFHERSCHPDKRADFGTSIEMMDGIDGTPLFAKVPR